MSSEKSSTIIAEATQHQDIDPKLLIEQVLDSFNVPPLTALERSMISAPLQQLFIRDLVRAFGSLSGIRGKKILDIGCGSVESKDPRTAGKGGRYEDMTPTRTFEPWTCRVLVALGAEVIGIDQGRIDDSEFIHYQRDIKDPSALDVIPDHSIDGVYMNSVLGSPEIMMSTAYEERVALKERLQSDIARVLKPEGKIISSDAHEAWLF